jgi:hypothetical protein
MGTILAIFVVIFFIIAVIALIVSFVVDDDDITKRAKSAVFPAFAIAVILMYLRYVIT